jgi:hypothetical protein
MPSVRGLWINSSAGTQVRPVPSVSNAAAKANGGSTKDDPEAVTGLVTASSSRPALGRGISNSLPLDAAVGRPLGGRAFTSP